MNNSVLKVIQEECYELKRTANYLEYLLRKEIHKDLEMENGDNNE